MKNIYKSLFLFSLALVFYSCVQEIDIVETNTTYHPSEITITTTSIQGIVKGPHGKPLNGVVVTLLNSDTPKQTITDENGYYYFLDAIVYDQIAHLKVEMNGFFEGFHHAPVLNNKIMTDDFVLIPLKFPGFITGAEGGTLVFPYTKFIVFPPGVIVDTNGDPFDGEVAVYIDYFDDTQKEDFPKRIGGTKGLTLENEVSAIGKYITIRVKLFDTNGHPLNIAPGKKVKIVVDVPEDLSVDENDLSLAYFDTNNQIWVQEEENVTIENGKFVTEVSHFSTFSICHFLQPVAIKGRAVFLVPSESGIGNPMEIGAQVFVNFDYYPLKFRVESTADGYFIFPFSLNLPFDLVFEDQCENEIYRTPYDAITGVDTFDIGKIIIPKPDDIVLHKLKATLFDCDSMLVQGGYARLCFDDYLVKHRCQMIEVNEGKVDFDFIYCDEDLHGQLKLIDLQNNLTTPTVSINLNFPEVNLNNVFLCNEYRTYMKVIQDGNQTLYEKIISYGCMWHNGTSNPAQHFYQAFNGLTGDAEYGISVEFSDEDPPFHTGEFELKRIVIFRKDIPSTWYGTHEGDVATMTVTKYISADDPHPCPKPALLEGIFEATLHKDDPDTGELLTIHITGEMVFDNQ